MDTIPEKKIRLHVKGAAALEIPELSSFDGIMPVRKKDMQIKPLYREGDEAVFDLAAQAGKFVLYRIVR